MDVYENDSSNYTSSNPLNLPIKKSSMLYEIEKCSECDVHQIEYCCNKCGDGVCLNPECCELFPHSHNTKFVVCRQCANKIEEKLVVLLNHNDLRLLKDKINKQIKKGRPLNT
jgi:hypothetical protein